MPDRQCVDILQRVLKLTSEYVANPDLRDRGIFYWRLISHDIEVAREVVLVKKPPIRDSAPMLEKKLTNKIFGHTARCDFSENLLIQFIFIRICKI